MKRPSTDKLLTLGMALHADKRTLKGRVRGVFARGRSTGPARALALLFCLLMGLACFTTACVPAETAIVTIPGPQGADMDVCVTLSKKGDSFTLPDGAGRQARFSIHAGDTDERARNDRSLKELYRRAAVRAAYETLLVFEDAVTDMPLYVSGPKDVGGHIDCLEVLFGGADFPTAQFSCLLSADTRELSTLHRSDRELPLIPLRYEEVQAYDGSDFTEALQADALATAAALVERCYANGREVAYGADGSAIGGMFHDAREPYTWYVNCMVRMSEGACYRVNLYYPAKVITEVTVCPLGWEQCRGN